MFCYFSCLGVNNVVNFPRAVMLGIPGLWQSAPSASLGSGTAMDLTCPQMYMDVTHDTLGKPPESAHDALSSRGDRQCCSLVLAEGPHGAEHLPTHSGLCGQMDTHPRAPLRRRRSRNKSGEVPSASQARTIEKRGLSARNGKSGLPPGSNSKRACH